MELLKEAFIEGYKQRAESSDLIFDNASRMYAISLFDKWKSEQLLLHNVSQQRELLLAYNEEVNQCMVDSQDILDESDVNDFLANNCG
jgi:hypothetical protein